MNTYYCAVSVDAVSSASFLYAAARTYAEIETQEFVGTEYLPAKPAECVIVFKVRIMRELVEMFQKLARVSLHIAANDTEGKLVINSLDDYYKLPYTVQVSKKGLDALREYSDHAAPPIHLTIQDIDHTEKVNLLPLDPA